MDYSNVAILFTVLGFVGIGVTAWEQSVGYEQTSLYLSAFASILSLTLALIFVTYHAHIVGKEKDERQKQD